MNCNTIIDFIIMIISLIEVHCKFLIPNGMLLCSRYSLLKVNRSSEQSIDIILWTFFYSWAITESTWHCNIIYEITMWCDLRIDFEYSIDNKQLNMWFGHFISFITQHPSPHYTFTWKMKYYILILK